MKKQKTLHVENMNLKSIFETVKEANDLPYDWNVFVKASRKLTNQLKKQKIENAENGFEFLGLSYKPVYDQDNDPEKPFYYQSDDFLKLYKHEPLQYSIIAKSDNLYDVFNGIIQAVLYMSNPQIEQLENNIFKETTIGYTELLTKDELQKVIESIGTTVMPNGSYSPEIQKFIMIIQEQLPELSYVFYVENSKPLVPNTPIYKATRELFSFEKVILNLKNIMAKSNSIKEISLQVYPGKLMGNFKEIQKYSKEFESKSLHDLIKLNVEGKMPRIYSLEIVLDTNERYIFSLVYKKEEAK